MSQEEAEKTVSGETRRSRALPVLLSVGMVCIAAAWFYLHFTFNRSVGSGPAGPPVAVEPFSKPWSSRPVLLVGLGDSVTAGFGARKGYSYFDRLIANPSDEFSGMEGRSLSSVFPNLQSTNLAVSGTVSQQVLGSQLPKLRKSDPAVLGLVVITTGGNDLIHSYGKFPPGELAMYGASWEQARPWIDNFADRLEKIIGGIGERFPGDCHIFLANIYDPSDAAGDIGKAGLPAWPDGLKIVAAYNEVIARAAQAHANVHLVDIRSVFLGHGIHAGQPWSKHYRREDPHYWYHTNLEDPNERGYDAIRRVFLNEMAKVLVENPTSKTPADLTACCPAANGLDRL